MKENKNCILVKKKDYDKLVELAEANKPGDIGISIYTNHINYNGSIDLESNLYSQIVRIIRSVNEKFELKHDKITSQRKEANVKAMNEKTDAVYFGLKNLNIFKLYRTVRDYKYH